MNSREFNQQLWKTVWQGAVTNDGIAALRQGLAHQFEMPDAVFPVGNSRRQRPSPGRRTFLRWQKSSPPGNWFRIILDPKGLILYRSHS